MTEDYQQRIEEAKSEIVEIEKDIFDLYLERIRKDYVEGSLVIRALINRRLENIIELERDQKDVEDYRLTVVEGLEFSEILQNYIKLYLDTNKTNLFELSKRSDVDNATLYRFMNRGKSVKKTDLRLSTISKLAKIIGLKLVPKKF